MRLPERSLTYTGATLGRTVKKTLHLRYKYKGCSTRQVCEAFGEDIRLQGKHPRREMCSYGHLEGGHWERVTEEQIREA